jgi:phenylalanine-4-hydroxylase
MGNIRWNKLYDRGLKMTKEYLFKEFDNLLEVLRYENNLSTSDIFRLLNEYQNTLADNITKSNNRQLVQSANLTSLYELQDSLKLAKTKKKYQIHRLVNLFCSGITEESQVKHSSETEKEVLMLLLERKEEIIENKEWYLKIIPNSAWLIQLLEYNTRK